MPDTRAASPSHGGPVQLFYAKKGAVRRPTVARAEGIYMWDTEGAIKLARQYAVVRGETSRWKVIAREPGYHGGTLGALAITGDPEADRIFGALMKPMPKVPAPFSHRLPANHDADSYARKC